MIKEHWNLLSAIYGGWSDFSLDTFRVCSAGYLTFAFYVLSQTAFLIAFRGIGLEWPDALEWHRISIPFLSALLQILDYCRHLIFTRGSFATYLEAVCYWLVHS